ncbi:MAG: 5'/3'-nucleotidase SurE [Paludibacteraceae bacterium]|nr:5'/3'-nucleotidase SurE [Paludibacteraceae bacterium]
MRILITNDDGWGTPGIRLLVEQLQTLGEVIVVAPKTAQSGMSNAISVGKMLRIDLVEQTDGKRVYTCNGTPSDCVKMGLEIVCHDLKPDLLVAGINHGSNAAVNVIYSGTMGAVYVGAEYGIPSIGFSLDDHRMEADFSHYKPYLLPITQKLIEMSVERGVCFNVNAPTGPLKGFQFARQCKGYWDDEFAEYHDPNGGTFYLMKGVFRNIEPEACDTDESVMKNGYIAITPTSVDTTHYPTFQKARQ